MRLLTLEPNPSFGGGSETVALDLSRELAGRGHEMFLLHEVEGSMLPAYRRFVSEAFQFSLPRSSLRASVATLGCAARIGHLARSRGIDVVLSSHLGYIRIAALVRGLYGVPFCFHLGLPPIGSPRFSRMAYRWISAGVAPSDHTREAWHRAGWPSKTLVTLPNWVDTDRFRPSPDRYELRQQLHIPQDSRCIVFVGRVCPEKGIETLIRAFPLVRSMVSGANLVVVGNPPPEYVTNFNQLMTTLDDEARHAIILRPATSTPEKYFAAGDVACVPSFFEEPFGLTLLEAMACAVPVIATSVGLFPRIIGAEHRDLLVARADHVALAERLAWWLTGPKARAECGVRLRQRAIQYYGPRESVDAYERILTDSAAEVRDPTVPPIDKVNGFSDHNDRCN